MTAPGAHDRFRADDAELFDMLSTRLGAAQRRRIAAADYGTDRAQHEAAIAALCAGKLSPEALPWHPREVLELTRWQEGDAVDHTARLFACTALLYDLMGARDLSGHESTLAVFVESALALGGGTHDAALAFLAALSERVDGAAYERHFVRLALAVAAAARDPDDVRLASLAASIVADVDADMPHPHELARAEHGWLFGLSFFDQRLPLWRHLIARHLPNSPALATLLDRLRVQTISKRRR